MRRYLVYSGVSHTILFALFLTFSALLSKPRMSYYAVDLVMSGPAGTPGMAAAAPQAIPEPKRSVPLPAPPEERQPPPLKESIRVRGREKPKIKPPPVKRRLTIPGQFLSAEPAAGHGRSGVPGAGGGGGGAGVVGQAGPAFPYPWYLKAIADRLDQKWHPPQEFQADTICQVAFTIRRDGQVSDSTLEKSSGDSVFDQLAQRAILYANPLPPLPAGFPDETLRVHMKFVGKPF